MVSLLLISPDQTKITQYIQQLCQKESIDPFDRTVFSYEGSIGIEDIRQIQTKLFLKPFKSQQKLLQVQHAEMLTIEAQNALLKILEEPPANTYIVLTAATSNTLLPTILSRCTIIELGSEPESISTEKKSELIKTVLSLASTATSEKLALAQEISKDKRMFSTWLEEAMISLREELIATQHIQIAEILLQMQEAYRLNTTTNTNSRMIAEHLLLSIS